MTFARGFDLPCISASFDSRVCCIHRYYEAELQRSQLSPERVNLVLRSTSSKHIYTLYTSLQFGDFTGKSYLFS
jgi:hypothetical protein